MRKSSHRNNLLRRFLHAAALASFLPVLLLVSCVRDQEAGGMDTKTGTR